MTLHLVHSAKKPELGSCEDDAHTKPTATIRMANLVVEYDSLFSLKCKRLAVSGNVISIIGHNGAGKSTLLKSILDLLPIKHGRITALMNHSGAAFKLYPEQHMAFCPESGAVFSDISVENYIKLWCRIRHRNARYYREEGAYYIELLNLQPLLKKLGRELSKGQRRRVQTAIGFIMQPELFLLDEPFDGLDVQKTHELSEIIESHSSKMAFILSSHRMDVIERLSDSVIVLDQGSIFAKGDVKKVSSQLAGRSISITISSAPEKILPPLKERFPGMLINHISNQIIITGQGSEPNPQSLREILWTCGIQNYDLEESSPTLVDAMNYHLRKMSLPPKT